VGRVLKTRSYLFSKETEPRLQGARRKDQGGGREILKAHSCGRGGGGQVEEGGLVCRCACRRFWVVGGGGKMV